MTGVATASPASAADNTIGSIGLPAVSRPASPSARDIRTILVGTGQRAAKLARSLRDEQHRHIVGAVDLARLPHLWDEMPDASWLGLLSELPSLSLAHAVDEICVALPLKSCFDEWLQVSRVGRELGIPVSFHLDLASHSEWTELRALADTTLLRCNVHPSSRRYPQWAKRLFDIVVASAALLALSPLLLMAAVLVKLTSPGPILFRQPRVGRNRRVFGMLKFRTMVVNAEELRAQIEQLNDAKGIMFKIKRDPRLTRVGPLLRRTSIDELPQLINVLRGEMSLVGPRPIPVWVYEQIDEPSFHRRFSVLPGMTGLWQVHGRKQQTTEMARHDLAYVERWSLWLDLEILARTIPAVIRRGEAV